jgi:hypothetical protein
MLISSLRSSQSKLNPSATLTEQIAEKDCAGVIDKADAIDISVEAINSRGENSIHKKELVNDKVTKVNSV